MCKQLKRAKKSTDTMDMELVMDMMVVFSKKEEERNADIAIVERLAKKLDLHTVEDLKDETIAIRKLIKERKNQNSECAQRVIEILNKFKQAAGMEITDVCSDPVLQKSIWHCSSFVIPPDYLCPITLEIMKDPVTVATGQVISSVIICC